MEKINWKVDGMTCSNCSLTITKYLQEKGRKNVSVNPITGDVLFDREASDPNGEEKLIGGIEDLGFTVRETHQQPRTRKKIFSNHWQRFLFCAVFTLPLMLHMLDRWVHIPWIMHPWVQFGLCLPVYIVGMDFFGRSALRSIRNRMPNMNVLIAIGSTAAFVYSLAGTLLGLGPDYLFYETAAAIITLVFLGNHLEDVSVRSTQSALNKLAGSQQVTANMIAFDENHQEVIMPLPNDQLRSGDLVLIRSGEQVPADCKILTGEGSVDESIITGESMPVDKKPKDRLVGGSILTDGVLKAQVTAEAKHSVLANIIDLVKRAQGEKPPIQLLADRISAVFVPVVLVIAAATFLINLLVLQQFTDALMRAIAVLVIACPCAMGLATPAAIAVGLGRAAREGILFRHARSLELFRDIRQVVFDKTGTLTTGDFSIANFRVLDTGTTEDTFKRIVYSLEKYSNHPLAKAVAHHWKTKNEIRWSSIQEVKGRGMQAVSKEGDRYEAGSYKVAGEGTDDPTHNIYVMRNGVLLGWVDLQDTIRPGVEKLVDYLKQKKIRTILLSGDRYETCRRVADTVGITEIIAEQTPEQKLEVITRLTGEAPTIMVGDGINDAPALAKATIGVSLSEASQVASQTADVVLMNNGLDQLPQAVGLGKHTFLTIKQNLFWAFFYNVLAIPVAALGFLTPAFGALVMGMSDVVLAANSVRLYVKKVA